MNDTEKGIQKFLNPKEVKVSLGKNEYKTILIEVFVENEKYEIPIELVIGKNAKVICVALVSIIGNGTVLLKSTQTHNAEGGYSDFLCKAVVRNGFFSYKGAIEISKKGNKSHAYQRNENLVLGNGAAVATEPLLEIEAHEVFCTHGATVSCISEDQEFYLSTRGLTKHQSEKLISVGFLEAGRNKLIQGNSI